MPSPTVKKTKPATAQAPAEPKAPPARSFVPPPLPSTGLRVAKPAPEKRVPRDGDKTTETWRKARLAALVAVEYGGSKVELEVAISREPAPGKTRPDGAYISHLISPKHAFGQLTARRLESSLGLEPMYFDQPPEVDECGGLQVPLVDLTVAGLPVPGDAERVNVPWRAGARSFAVVMPDDSMAGPMPHASPISIPAGYIVIVDPDAPVDMDRPCIVCAKLPGSTSATVRRLIAMDGVHILRPNNPVIYDNSRVLTDAAMIVGRVIGAFSPC
jgi:SOS-response transcriptional repressor LexA